MRILEEVLEPMVLNICRKVMKPTVITTVRQEIVPVAEDLFRRVLREEIQAVEEKLLARGSGKELPKERILQLKFLDELSDTVQTSTELKGTKGECLQVALVDANGEIVNCGPESSAKVEIVVLDDTNGITLENFERSIIKTGDKKKPHFATSVYIYLDKGVGSLTGVKLGQDSVWTRNYNCRLGARMVQNFRGVIVEEAWTAPRKVQDNRIEHSKKHHPPSLSSEVWRLVQIGKNGERCDRLEKKNIKNLRDFLFWLYVDPEGLRRILLVGDCVWESIVTHAGECCTDDKTMFSHKSSTDDPQMLVIYDEVGRLKGVFNESRFVPIDNMSSDEKDVARKLLVSVLGDSVFGERYNTPFNYEAATNSSSQHCLKGNDVNLSENISGYQTTEGGSSSQNIDPSSLYDSGPSDSLGSEETGELFNPVSGSFADRGTHMDLDNRKHKTPSLLHSSMLPEKDKADDRELLASGHEEWGNMKAFEDMDRTEQHLTALDACRVSLPTTITYEMVGESSSRRSNSSFLSFDDDIWCVDECPASPPLFHHVEDTNSYNTRINGCGDEPCGAEPRVADPPKPWKRLTRMWSSFTERMSMDASRSDKKRKLG